MSAGLICRASARSIRTLSWPVFFCQVILTASLIPVPGIVAYHANDYSGEQVLYNIHLIQIVIVFVRVFICAWRQG